jgi:hypothetical protein
LAANAWVKIQLNSKDLDTDNSYDATTNYRFTPKVAGYYQMNTMIYFIGNTAGVNLAIYKNGGFFALIDYATSSVAQILGHPTIVSANGVGDYFEWYAYSQTNTINVVNRSGGSPTTATWIRTL